MERWPAEEVAMRRFLLYAVEIVLVLAFFTVTATLLKNVWWYASPDSKYASIVHVVG